MFHIAGTHDILNTPTSLANPFYVHLVRALRSRCETFRIIHFITTLKTPFYLLANGPAYMFDIYMCEFNLINDDVSHVYLCDSCQQYIQDWVHYRRNIPTGQDYGASASNPVYTTLVFENFGLKPVQFKLKHIFQTRKPESLKFSCF